MEYKLSSEQQAFLAETWLKTQEKFKAEQERNGEIVPYIATNGKYSDVEKENFYWWTNGFWPGILWQMYHATKIEAYKHSAEGLEKRMDKALNQFDQLDHDVGFMWLSASVADYKLTKNQEAKSRGIRAAEVLASRYNPTGCFLSAWNGLDKQGQIIIDCLMNLPLLFWATKQTGDPRFSAIAKNHANTTLKYLIRKDGSVNHIAVINPYSGEFEENLGGQGYGKGSSWSRGQAWAIYGMALAYRDTQDSIYLAKAKNTAHYFISNIALTDFVSQIDFRAPKLPVYMDTTATAIAMRGILEIAKYVSAEEKDFYVQAAWKMFVQLTTHYCNFDKTQDGLLTHGSAKYHRESDREVPIIYGDYYYLETLLCLLNKDLLIY
jgi:unsaturated chondroitin disaccharide hydrolase